MSLFGESLKKSSNTAVQVSGGVAEGLQGAAQGAIKGVTKEIKRIRDELLGRDISGGSVLDSGGFQVASPWGKLSPLLLAKISPCDPRTGQILAEDSETGEIFYPVVAPITDFNLEGSFTWQSPFENAGTESKAPALMALIQSGQVSVYMNMLQGALGGVQDSFGGGLSAKIAAPVIDAAQTAAKKAGQLAGELEGRTGITKLNSRQVFSGMPPVKMTGNMHFRAVMDAMDEVVMPYNQLWRWSVPRQLADDGVLAAIYQNVQGGGGFIKGLFPSKAPRTVALTYAGETFGPLIIESIGAPLDGPKDTAGNSIHKVVNLSLSSLTALDEKDITLFFK